MKNKSTLKGPYDPQEVVKMMAWVGRLTAAERVLTCAFCGEAYPPGTPESNDGALLAHILICMKHPMRGIEARHGALRVALQYIAAGEALTPQELVRLGTEALRDDEAADECTTEVP